MQDIASDCPDEAVTIHKDVMDEEDLVFEDNTFHLVTTSLRLDWCRILSAFQAGIQELCNLRTCFGQLRSTHFMV